MQTRTPQRMLGWLRIAGATIACGGGPAVDRGADEAALRA